MTTIIKYPLRNINDAVLRDLQEKYPEAELQIALESDRPHDGLTEQGFWDLIALLDWNKTGDDSAVIEPLILALVNAPVRHIYEFDDILSQKLYKIDGLSFARQIGESAWRPDQYFSVDVFLYARCCAVANGQAYYQQLLNDPAQMPKDMDFGALLRVVSEAYTRKTGNAYTYLPAYPIETYSNKTAWLTPG